LPFVRGSREALYVNIGYARISTGDQNLALQRDTPTAAGCDPIYEDTKSDAKADRPRLELALEVARAGDLLVVWRVPARPPAGRPHRASQDAQASRTLKDVVYKLDADPAGETVVLCMAPRAQILVSRDRIRCTGNGISSVSRLRKVSVRPRSAGAA
jgi:hypothetical protein